MTRLPKKQKNPPTPGTLLRLPAPTASAQELRGFQTPSVLFFLIILIGRGGEHDVFQISAVAVFDTMSVSRSSAGKFHRL